MISSEIKEESFSKELLGIVLKELRSALERDFRDGLDELKRYRGKVESLKGDKFIELCDNGVKLASLISGLLPLRAPSVRVIAEEIFGKTIMDVIEENKEIILDVLSQIVIHAINIERMQNLLHNKPIIEKLGQNLERENIITPSPSAAIFEVLAELGMERLKEHDDVREALILLLKFLTDDRIISKDLGFYDVIYFNINGIRPILHDLTTTSRIFLTFCLYYNEILSNKDIFGDLVEKTRECIARTTSGVIRLIDHYIRRGSSETSEWMTYFITKEEEKEEGVIQRLIPNFEDVLKEEGEGGLKTQTKWIIDPTTEKGLYNLLNIVYMLLTIKELLLRLKKENKDEAKKLEDKIREMLHSEKSVDNELDALLAFLYRRLKKKIYLRLKEVKEREDIEIRKLLEKLEENTLLPRYESQEITLERSRRSFIPYLARFLIKIYRILGSEDRYSYSSLIKEEDIQTLYALLGWTVRLIIKTYSCRKKANKKMFGLYLRGEDEHDISGLNYYMIRTYFIYFDSIERVFLGDPDRCLYRFLLKEVSEKMRQPLEVMIIPTEKREIYEITVTDHEDPSYYNKLYITIHLDRYSEDFENPARAVSELSLRLRSGSMTGIETYKDVLKEFKNCLEGRFDIFGGGDAFISGEADKLGALLQSLLKKKEKPIIIKFPSSGNESSQPYELFAWELIRVEDKHIGLSFPIGRIILSGQGGREPQKVEEDVIRVLLMKGSGGEKDREIFEEEIENLKRLFEGIRSEGYYITVEVVEKRNELRLYKNMEWDIVHYTGHTKYDNRSGKWLWELEDDTLWVDSLAQMFERAPSLVFSNSCESARSERSYGDHVRFPAKEFLEKGTKAYIGTLFPLVSELALELCDTFYKKLLEEKLPVGESLLLALQEIGRSKTVDKLAEDLKEGMGESEDIADAIKKVLTTIYTSYVLYGDPLYRLVR